MFNIFASSQRDLDALSIREMLDTYGLESKIAFSKEEAHVSGSHVITNDFILTQNFRRKDFSDKPLFINAYSKKALEKIGIIPVKNENLKVLHQGDDEYHTDLLIEKPQFLFKTDQNIVNGPDGLSAVGIYDGIGISTIPYGQFLVLRNGWISRLKNSGKYYPLLNRFPLTKTAKRVILPAYNLLRQKDRTMIEKGFDVNLLLRESLALTCEELAGKELRKKARSLPVLLTHDVDRQESVSGVKALKEIEGSFGFSSCWYINKEALKAFKVENVIDENCYSHFDTHDGQLSSMSQEEIIRSLMNYNLNDGFRAPWSHHSIELFEALEKTGYTHDSSMPSYEDFTPFYRPGGCLDIVPFKPILPSLRRCNFLEIPMTLPVDYGLFVIQKLGAEDAFKKIKDRMDFIVKHQGIINLVTHPDMKDSGSPNGQKFYQMVLGYIDSKKELKVMNIPDLLG